MIVKIIDGIPCGRFVEDGEWVPVAFKGLHINFEKGAQYKVDGVYLTANTNNPMEFAPDPTKAPWSICKIVDNPAAQPEIWHQADALGQNSDSGNGASQYSLGNKRMSPTDLSSLSPDEIQIAWEENKRMEITHSINNYLKRFGITNNLTKEQIQGIFDRMQAPCVLNTEDVAGAYLVANALLSKDSLSVEKPTPTLYQIFNGLQHKAHKLARLSFLYKCFREEFRLPQSAGMEELKAAIREKNPDVADFLVQSMDNIQKVVDGVEMSNFHLELLLTHMTTLAGAVIPQSKRRL